MISIFELYTHIMVVDLIDIFKWQLISKLGMEEIKLIHNFVAFMWVTYKNASTKGLTEKEVCESKTVYLLWHIPFSY